MDPLAHSKGRSNLGENLGLLSHSKQNGIAGPEQAKWDSPKASSVGPQFQSKQYGTAVPQQVDTNENCSRVTLTKGPQAEC